MSFAVRNTGRLRQIALRLREAPRKIQRQAAEEIREATLELIDAGFAARTDPYGAPWPQPKDGHRPVMERSGDLRRGYRVAVVPSGAGLAINIGNVKDYARHLQRGGEHLKARLQVPTQSRGLPESWRRRFEAVYERAIAAWYATLK